MLLGVISLPHAFCHVSENDDGDELHVRNPAQIAGDENENGSKDASNSFEPIAVV